MPPCKETVIIEHNFASDIDFDSLLIKTVNKKYITDSNTIITDSNTTVIYN
jgi:hypothetical protein